MKRRGPKLCPPLRFKCEDEGTAEYGPIITCRAINVEDGQEEAGWITLERAKHLDTQEFESDFMQIGMVRAFPRRRDEARCGVGTRLYETALAEACRRGLRLSSDTSRTRFSEKFWKKQVEKGRAECVYTQKKGHRGAAMLDESLSDTGRRWRCRRYAMKGCPSTIDLSGATKRVDWRSESVIKRRRK